MQLLAIYCLVFLFAFCHVHRVNSVFLDTKGKVDYSTMYVMFLPNIQVTHDPEAKNRPPPNMGTNISFYKNLSRNHTVDERCKRGLPLSMAVYPLMSPYLSSGLFLKPNFKTKVVEKNGTNVTIRVPDITPGFKYFGLFPEILKRAIPTCCHAGSNIRFVKTLRNQSVPADLKPEDDYDFSFPLYGNSMKDTEYRSNPFIPVIQSPSVVLLIASDKELTGKTHFIATTIFKAWPMFLFMLLIASSAGIVMWCLVSLEYSRRKKVLLSLFLAANACVPLVGTENKIVHGNQPILDRSKNEDQFPKPFLDGAFEGFWWAFITMTTVGYGDRTPKSFLGRFFCILWIIFGIVIICILSGIMTAALSASTKIHFNIHGAKIGAVSGSEEFRFGLSLNAEMHVSVTWAANSETGNFQSEKMIPSRYFLNNCMEVRFGSQSVCQYGFGWAPKPHVHAVATSSDGVLADSYSVSSWGKRIARLNLKTERNMAHPLTYGIRMTKGSENLQKCLRKYLRDHPQEVFKMLRKYLTMVKNPKDRINRQQKEAESLFTIDNTMRKMLEYGGYFVIALLALGLGYEGLVTFIERTKGRKSKFIHRIVTDAKWGHSSSQADRKTKELLDQYSCFQNDWMKKMKALRKE